MTIPLPHPLARPLHEGQGIAGGGLRSQVTVSVTDPGDMVVYYESPADQARYADPAATGRPAIPYNPATEATIEVRYAAATPTWQQRADGDRT
jgi:hypothetical protein